MTDTSQIALDTADGHRLNAFLAVPGSGLKGRVVIIQEVFGVNHHIRAVCEYYATHGYAALAPSLFDRVSPGIELGYTEGDLAHGRELRTSIGWEGPVRDVAAALDFFKKDGPAGVIGYCWGASVAWLAATRLQPACAVCYYGGQIVQFKDEKPNCPVLMHFGEEDTIIPPEDREAIIAAQPMAEAFVYPAGHGFNCTERDSFHAESAKLALDRTMAFLEKHLA
jgi:carboxymethylenebutenolidase